MYNEINEKMAALKEGVARLKQINLTLLIMKADLQVLQQKEYDLRVILEYENYDVESLENNGFATFLYSKFGTLDKHLDKERGEALTAKLKYEQVVKEIDDMESQISSLEAESLPYKDNEATYDALFAQKKAEILKDAGEAGQKILALTEKIRLSKIRVTEINKEVTSGNSIIAILDDALDCINKAEFFSARDCSRFSSGVDLFDDLDKHSCLDQAKTAIDIVKLALSRFHTELVNIEITAVPSIHTGGFAKFADFYYDGWMADWSMQERIDESVQSVHDVKYEVLVIVGILKNIEINEKEKGDRLEAEINTIIVEA